ncbi:uncharacterized protein LOC128762994 isoform X2 [Synchiropus splendidus]|uniref:uncharacterized protein LOC128762994 isoform X2 n=1 Tax=Synchiropus splendidus TaxID=270530 RepID=UPI00237E1359|nr:uncharacterized protein LOC128762994 isoform X2 [Synchiropus splendidus]
MKVSFSSFARFTSMGVCRAAHLSTVTMQDYPTLGICSMKDRIHLFHLIQFIKSLDLENPEYSDAAEETDASKKCLTREAYKKLSFCIKRLDSGKESFDSPTKHDFNHRKEKPVSRKICSPLVQPNVQLVYNNEADVYSYCYTSPSLTKGSSHSNRVPDKTAASKKLSLPLIRCKRKILRIRQFNPKLVYESLPMNGYNYGLPLSNPVVNKEKRAGEQRIKVCVRKKPLMYEESQTGETDVVTVANGDCVIVHESKEACDLTPYTQLHKFYFDQVFGEESTNEDVYLKTAYPLVRHTLNGGQSTCFAYGQTGAGKTHTMLGCAPGSLGLYTLAVRDIFAHLSTLQTPCPLTVYVSFFEIYCGHLYDLLDHRKRLYSREDGRKVVHIAGLAEVRVDSEHALLQVITHGTELRTQGVSGVNPQSSRSHALLQIQLRHPDQLRAGRMWFVDLAGSERASDSQKQTNRQSRMEGAEINQSLLALKECIRSLDQEQSHTPFRQSKLTQVLKDSFLGDAMTCMIANISPRLSATEHTLNTLRYADRVKELRRRKVARARNSASKCIMTNSKSGLTSAATKQIRPSQRSNKWAFDQDQKNSGVLRSSPLTVNQTVKRGTGCEQIPPVQTLSGVSKVMNKRECEEKEEADNRQQKHLFSSQKFGQHHQLHNEGSRTKRECRRIMDPEAVHSVKKTDEENERLRLYHHQLQEFVPSSAMSSPKQSSLSSSLRSSKSCSSQQFIQDALKSNRKGCDKREEVSRQNDTLTVKVLSKEGPRAVWEEMKVLGVEEERSENGRAPEKASGIQDHLDMEKGKTRRVQGCDSTAASSTSKKSSSYPTVEPVSLQTAAERPLSPVSSSKHTLHLMTNASPGCVPSFTRLQKGKQEPSPCVSREKRRFCVDNLRVSSPLCTALTQDICGLHSETVITSADLQILNKMTAGEKHAAQGRTYTLPETSNYATDPPSISMPADQQVAPAKLNRTFSFSDSEEEQINNKAPDHDVDLCLEEASQATTKSSPCSPTSSGTYSVAHKNCPTSKHYKIGVKYEDHNSESSTSRQSCRSMANLLTSRDSGFSSHYDNGCDATGATQSCAPVHHQKRETHGPRKSAPSVRINSPLESNINIQEKKHTKSSTMVQAQCHIVQAHVTQLKEMEVLSQKDEELLSQRENMSFGFYIQKLEDIMKKKAQCVHNMRYKLQPYL